MISVVIPNWNGKKYLRDCLDSLYRGTYRDFEIIIVDNGSEDGSVDFVQRNYPEIKIISLQRNTGVSHALNLGIENARGDR